MKQCMRGKEETHAELAYSHSSISSVVSSEEKEAHQRSSPKASIMKSLKHDFPSELFSPHRVRDMVVANRIVVPPMCMYSANDAGLMSHFHQFQYTEYAVGGAGLIFVEATAVSPIGRLSDGCMGLYNEANIPLFRALNDFIHANTHAKMGIQLSHGGRKAGWTRFPWNGDHRPLRLEEGGWEVIAPSPIRYGPTSPAPREMNLLEIEEVKMQFAEAARRAVLAGFDTVEIHAAHGYLLHQFLSPLTNQRLDMYGGSRANRFRFVREVCGAVREVLPVGMPLAVRLSAVDWAEGGITIEDTVALCHELREVGVDIFDISSGGIVDYQKLLGNTKPGFQVPFAAAVKRALPLATVICVGMITEPEQAELYLMKNQADLVGIGREMLRNPRWPKLAAHRLNVDPKLVHTVPQHLCVAGGKRH